MNVGVVPKSPGLAARSMTFAVSEEGLKKIIPYLPEAAKFCPHLKIGEGYANVFEKAERGLYAIDTHDNGPVFLACEADGLTALFFTRRGNQSWTAIGFGETRGLHPLATDFFGFGRCINPSTTTLLAVLCSSPREIPSSRISPIYLRLSNILAGKFRSNSHPLVWAYILQENCR